MILTEEAAKSKWCPHARVIFNHRDEEKMRTHAATSYNRSSDPMPLSHCLGSGCMAWDWVEGPGKPARRGTCGMQGASRALELWDVKAERQGIPAAAPDPASAPVANGNTRS